MSAIRPTTPTPTAERTRPHSTRRSGFGIALLFPLLSLLVLAGCADDGPIEADLELQAARSTATAEQVSDLSVTSTTATTATVTWSQVTDARGKEAWYELRHAPSPLDWDGASVVTSGECASPIKGQQHGDAVTCTVDGLSAERSYDFQVASFRRGDDADGSSAQLSNVATGTTESDGSSDDSGGSDDGTDDSGGSDDGSDDSGGDTTAAECDAAGSGWIWCDDFEQDRLAEYFEYDSHGGDFERVAGVGMDGSAGMRARWSSEGQVGAGNLKLAFGRTPQAYMDPVDDGTSDYREVYWRFFLKHEADWTGGGGDKLARGTIFASSDSWAQAMIAHVWSGSSPDEDYLVIDPASGTDEEGNLQTTKYNDFDNLRWLGADRGSLPLFDADHVGEWYCVEVRVRLNDAGSENGEFQLWIDGVLDAERTGLNWVGDYDDYGINALFLENHWNEGAPKAQERYFDNFVVSTEPIGCSTS